MSEVDKTAATLSSIPHPGEQRTAGEPAMTQEQLAVLFHETYERLAPAFGYKTRRDTRKFDPTSDNGRLMITVCGTILRTLFPPASAPPQEARIARLRDDWHEDTGPVLWWHFPIVEPPYCGTPNDQDWPIDYAAGDDGDPVEIDYCTHWTPIAIPKHPEPPQEPL